MNEFNGHLEYFTEIWDILLPFGTLCVHLVHFFTVLVSWTKKNLATLVAATARKKKKTN
jgi:hypothetical protein